MGDNQPWKIQEFDKGNVGHIQMFNPNQFNNPSFSYISPVNDQHYNAAPEYSSQDPTWGPNWNWESGPERQDIPDRETVTHNLSNEAPGNYNMNMYVPEIDPVQNYNVHDNYYAQSQQNDANVYQNFNENVSSHVTNPDDARQYQKNVLPQQRYNYQPLEQVQFQQGYAEVPYQYDSQFAHPGFCHQQNFPTSLGSGPSPQVSQTQSDYGSYVNGYDYGHTQNYNVEDNLTQSPPLQYNYTNTSNTSSSSEDVRSVVEYSQANFNDQYSESTVESFFSRDTDFLPDVLSNVLPAKDFEINSEQHLVDQFSSLNVGAPYSDNIEPITEQSVSNNTLHDASQYSPDCKDSALDCDASKFTSFDQKKDLYFADTHPVIKSSNLSPISDSSSYVYPHHQNIMIPSVEQQHQQQHQAPSHSVDSVIARGEKGSFGFGINERDHHTSTWNENLIMSSSNAIVKNDSGYLDSAIFDTQNSFVNSNPMVSLPSRDGPTNINDNLKNPGCINIDDLDKTPPPKLTPPSIRDFPSLQHVENLKQAHNSTPITVLWEQPNIASTTRILAPARVEENLDISDSHSEKTSLLKNISLSGEHDRLKSTIVDKLPDQTQPRIDISQNNRCINDDQIRKSQLDISSVNILSEQKHNTDSQLSAHGQPQKNTNYQLLPHEPQQPNTDQQLLGHGQQAYTHKQQSSVATPASMNDSHQKDKELESDTSQSIKPNPLNVSISNISGRANQGQISISTEQSQSFNPLHISTASITNDRTSDYSKIPDSSVPYKVSNIRSNTKIGAESLDINKGDNLQKDAMSPNISSNNTDVLRQNYPVSATMSSGPAHLSSNPVGRSSLSQYHGGQPDHGAQRRDANTDATYSRQGEYNYNMYYGKSYQNQRDAYGQYVRPYPEAAYYSPTYRGYYYGDSYYGYNPQYYQRGYSTEDYYNRPRSRQEEHRPASRTASESGRPESRGSVDYQHPSSRPGSRTDYYDPRSASYNQQGGSYPRDYGHSQYYYDQDYNYQRHRYNRGYYDELDYYGHLKKESGSFHGESIYDTQYPYFQRRGSFRADSRGSTPSLDSYSYDERYHYNRESSGRATYAGYPTQYGQSPYHGDGTAYDYSRYQNYNAYYYQSPQQPTFPVKAAAVPKFTLPHTIARFSSSGQLLLVLPNRPSEGQIAAVELHENETLLPVSEAEDLRVFPGPLVKGDTHKNDVLVFCQSKARECRENVSLVDRESHELIWKFLEILIKQNGTIVGTDITDLLLQGHEPHCSTYNQQGLKVDQTEVAPDNDTNVEANAGPKGQSLDVITDHYRRLLLYGRKKDALEWAMKNNLWGHALFLASKMDARAHAKVMIRFANSSMHINDPLQTLYQLMSSRQPAAVTGVADERWGDWRPHLAMILSNRCDKSSVDSRSIITLGDTLGSRGFLHASHFCYIVADVLISSMSQKSAKWILIGANHNSSLEEFITNSAIQCTEIFEFACSHFDSSVSLPHFQAFKFLYACRLAEYGHIVESLRYCEVIASEIQKCPSKYSSVLVNQVCLLADKLKCHDPERLHAMTGDLDANITSPHGSYNYHQPQWLTSLTDIYHKMSDGSIMAQLPSDHGTTTTASSESGDAVALTSSDTSLAQYMTGRQSADYTNYEARYQPDPQQPGFQADYHVMSQGYSIPANHNEQKQGGNMAPAFNPTQQNSAFYSYNESQTIDHDAAQYTSPYAAPATGQEYGLHYEDQQQVPSDHVDTFNANNSPIQTSAPFDYFASTTQHPFKGKIITRRRRNTSESSAASVSSVKAAPVPQPVAVKEDKEVKNLESKNGDSRGKGIFGGLFSKFSSFRRQNDIFLPDDKVKPIVWDHSKQRWVDTEAEEQGSENAPAPPPTDRELTPVQTLRPPDVSLSTTPSSENRFQKSKLGRGARDKYVDVLNKGIKPPTSGAVPTSLFDVMPSGSPTPQKILTPGGTPVSHLQVPKSHDHGSSNSGDELSRWSSYSSLGQEVNRITSQPVSVQTGITTTQPVPMTSSTPLVEHSNPPTTMPLLFNPTQFQSAPATTPGQTSTRPRYGQRRQYPK